MKPELQPDQSKFDPADPDLRAAANLLQGGYVPHPMPSRDCPDLALRLAAGS